MSPSSSVQACRSHLLIPSHWGSGFQHVYSVVGTSTEPPGESLCLKAQQGWYYWLLNHLCLWWNPTEISFQIYVYNLILGCHSAISYGVAVHAIYVSSPTHQCVFCHWVSMLYYPLSKCFDKLFFFIPVTLNSKTLHKITIYRINKSHWEAHAICLTERILL